MSDIERRAYETQKYLQESETKDIQDYKNIENKDFLFNNLEKISEFGLLGNEFRELDIRINNMKFIKKVLNEQFFKATNSTNISKFNDKFLIVLNVIAKKNDKLFLYLNIGSLG